MSEPLEHIVLPPEIEQRVQHMLPRDLLHDLRTPLGHILGYSELLIEQMQAAGHEEYVVYAEKIRKAGLDNLRFAWAGRRKAK